MATTELAVIDDTSQYATTIAASDTSTQPQSRATSIASLNDICDTNQESQPPIATKQNKWYQLFTNFLFWIRIFLLLLVIFLLFLSTSYCVAQLLQPKLELITECPESKTREEIWRHSYSNSVQYDDDEKLNQETQYGYTKEPCWTTRSFEINTHDLWYSNKYDYEWHTESINGKFLLFALVSLYSFAILVYITCGLAIDIVFVSRNALHTKFPAYRRYTKSQSALNSQSELEVNRLENATEISAQKHAKKKKKCTARCLQFYFRYFAQDTTGWIVQKFMSEVTEITLQSIALWLYNGYYVFDPNNENNTYLALKPQFIDLYAGFIAFNCFGSGILWLFYAFMSARCYGIKFKRVLFFVDKFSDFVYTIFPFLTLLYDDYNLNVNDYRVLLAQLNINSGLAFLATFLPLFLLCNTCLLIAYTTMTRLRKQYFEEYKSIHQATSPRSSSMHSSSASLQRIETFGSMDMSSTPRRAWDKNWIHKHKEDEPRIRYIKRASVGLLSTLLIVYGLVIIIGVTKHTQTAQRFCQFVADSVYNSDGSIKDESLWSDQLHKNPELSVWNHCLYKVYPFVNDDHYRCQCRVFVMEDWYQYRSTYDQRAASSFNLAQHNMVTGMLQTWYMMEKFKSSGTEAPVYDTYRIDSSMYSSRFMKAVEWTHARVTAMESGVSNWNKLEYLKIEGTTAITAFPDDFDQLTNIKILKLSNVGFTSFPMQICNMKQLISLQMNNDGLIQDEIPHCMTDLTAVKEIAFDYFIRVNSLPLALFSMPNLIDLSLFEMHLTYHQLLQYNLPSTINISDTAGTTEWFNENFAWNEESTYWLQNTLCAELNATAYTIPTKLRQFLLSSNVKCATVCKQSSVESLLCAPRNWGDGKCDDLCNVAECDFDGGDCMQLCFSPELSDCSWDLIANETEYPYESEKCDNKYCSAGWRSNFQLDVASINATECAASSANSSYFETPSPQIEAMLAAISISAPDYTCHADKYINNGVCEDVCRTEQCMYDGGDCALDCIDDLCSKGYALWTNLAGASQTNVKLEVFCSDYIQHIPEEAIATVIDSLGFDAMDAFMCSLLTSASDLNTDGYLNFRELISALMMLPGTVWQGVSTNCSSCVKDWDPVVVA